MFFIIDLYYLLRVVKFVLIVLVVCKIRFIFVCKYRYYWFYLELDIYFCLIYFDGLCLCDMYYYKFLIYSYE